MKKIVHLVFAATMLYSTVVPANIVHTGLLTAYLKCDTNPVGNKNERNFAVYLSGYFSREVFFAHWTRLQRVTKGKVQRSHLIIQGRQAGTKDEIWEIEVSGKRAGSFNTISGSFKPDIPRNSSLREVLLKGIEGKVGGQNCMLKVAENMVVRVTPQQELDSLSNQISMLEDELTKSKATEAELEKQEADYNEAMLKLLADAERFQSRSVKLQAVNQELKSKLSEALNQVAKQKQSNETKEQLAKKNEIVAKLTKQLEETKKALGDQRKKLDAQLKKVESENQSLTKLLSTMEETHKAEMVALKKLIPDESLQNQKLTKIASNASQKNSVMTSGSPSSASTQNLRMTFEARLLEKSKEFGDGFTNYVAGLNKTLLAIEITNAQFKSDSQMQLDQLEYVLLDEGKPAISASTEAYEAAMAQGLRISNEEASLRVFEVSMSLKTDSLKILAIDGASIFGESKLN